MSVKKEAKKLSKIIKNHYSCHNVNIKLRLVHHISKYQRFIYEIILKPGTKVNVVFSVSSDIKAALGFPLFCPFYYKSKVLLAVSMQETTDNSLYEILTSPDFLNADKQLPVALGYDLARRMIIADLAEMPHAMYTGSTNSGKSYGLVALIMSLLAVKSVNELNLVLFDIGGNTMDFFEDIPHLSYPIVKDQNTGRYVINALLAEMERRISLDQAELHSLPSIVCVMDEYVSFINNFEDKKDMKIVKNQISNLLRRGRKAKIHMVLATQNPTAKSMQTDINNITSRMAFKCAHSHTSVAIMGQGGAEKLTGKGSMLYISNELSEPMYIQGAYMPPEEIRKQITYLKNNMYDCSNKFILSEWEPFFSFELSDCILKADPIPNHEDKKLAGIIMWVLGNQTISALRIKDKFKIGNTAKDIIEQLVQMKLISEKDANKPRRVLIQSAEDLSDDVSNFLKLCGYSPDDIDAAINSRPVTSSMLPTASASESTTASDL